MLRPRPLGVPSRGTGRDVGGLAWEVPEGWSRACAPRAIGGSSPPGDEREWIGARWQQLPRAPLLVLEALWVLPLNPLCSAFRDPLGERTLTFACWAQEPLREGSASECVQVLPTAAPPPARHRSVPASVTGFLPPAMSACPSVLLVRIFPPGVCSWECHKVWTWCTDRRSGLQEL